MRKINWLPALTLIIKSTDDPLMKLLAIWLRGRCGEKYGAAIVLDCYESGNDAMRKEVIRALRRMSAWPQLDKIVEQETNPRLRKFASVRTTRPYSERLAGYTSHIPKIDCSPEPIPLYIAPSVDLGQGRHQKSSAFIRMILERIKLLLRGYRS